MARQQTLVIMVRFPRPGRVKTRLGRDIGMTAAAWWYRHHCARLIRTLADDPRWTCVLSVGTGQIDPHNPLFPPHLPLIAQGTGNLGDRMEQVFRTMPKGRVVIIGSDVLGMTRQHIAQAFLGLLSHDAVIGPAPDGGYWAIGLNLGANPLPATLFSNVRWSSEFALEDTVRSLGNLRLSLVATLADVDCAADLQASRLPRRPPARIPA